MILIRDFLTAPPSSPLVVRDLCLYLTIFRSQEILLVSDEKDLYWGFLKKYGLFDFLKDIVWYGQENGLYIDNQLVITHNPTIINPTVVVNRIVAENLNKIIKQI